MNREDDQPLWDILGKPAAPRVSPFFARDVVREIRTEAHGFAGLRSFFVWPKVAAFSGLAAAVLVASIAVHHSRNNHELQPSRMVAVSKVSPDEDFDRDIDDLVANDSDDDDVAVL